MSQHIPEEKRCAGQAADPSWDPGRAWEQGWKTVGVLAGFLVFEHCHFFSWSLKEKRAAAGEVKVLSHILSLEGMCCHNRASLFKLLAGRRDGSQGCLLHPSQQGQGQGCTSVKAVHSSLYRSSLLLSAAGANWDVLSWESSCFSAALLQEPSNLWDRGGGSNRWLCCEMEFICWNTWTGSSACRSLGSLGALVT